MQEKPRKFETLDALRGVAALLVVLHHLHVLFGIADPPHLYLAVDLFFALSGFVLSYAYQAKLDNGLSTGKFLLARLVRLWPLYLVGLIIGAFTVPPFAIIGNMVRQNRLIALVPGALFLPLWSKNVDASMYPLNGPAWSLTLELFMNTVHALILRRARTRSLLIFCGASGAGVIAAYLHFGYLNGGFSRASFLGIGVPRVLFSYTLGMLLFRSWKRGLGKFRVPSPLPCAVLCLTLCVPFPVISEGLYLLCILGVVFPALLLWGAYSEPGKALRRPFTVLGVASYAVYVLHTPLAYGYVKLWRGAADCAPWSGALFVLLVTSLAVWLDRVYDLPVRKRLRVWLHV